MFAELRCVRDLVARAVADVAADVQHEYLVGQINLALVQLVQREYVERLSYAGLDRSGSPFVRIVSQLTPQL